MRLVCHDLAWHAHRACHDKTTECVTKSKAVQTAVLAVGRCSSPFAERAMQELVQGPRRPIQALPGPSESESRKTNAFAPTASLHDSAELSARAVGDELRRIVALTVQKQASPHRTCVLKAVRPHTVPVARVVTLKGAAGVLDNAGGGGTRWRVRFFFDLLDHTTVVRLLLLGVL